MYNESQKYSTKYIFCLKLGQVILKRIRDHKSIEQFYHFTLGILNYFGSVFIHIFLGNRFDFCYKMFTFTRIDSTISIF